ncbi:MAG: type VI secretion system tip protein VgrG, partial [Polyangiaceae bacterium]|nr:type VI secretion system tip protein VgrG [Polyangiaceae bacterium]
MSINVSIDVDAPLPSGSRSTQRPYELLAFPFPPGHFLVHSFRGSEGMSSPYSFDISVTSALIPELDVEQLVLGQRAVFVMRTARVPRAIHGVIRAVRSEGVRSQGKRSQHRLRLVPAFELLRHNRRSRIFQNLSVPEVVERVLSGFSMRWSLSKAYPKRPYITQYEETDRAFVERLLAEAGIFYYFAQPSALAHQVMDMATDALESLGPLGEAAGTAAKMAEALLERETIVFGDSHESHVPIDTGDLVTAAADAIGVPTSVSLGPVTVGLSSPTLRYFDQPGLAVERFDTVTAFAPIRSIRASQAEFRDYDPDRPQFPYSAKAPGADNPLEAAISAVSANVTVDPSKGADAVQGSVSVDWTSLLPQQQFEEYDHHGRFHFPEWSDAVREPQRILARARRRAHVAKGKSLCPGLAPGHRFTLDEHPLTPSNREYVVTQVRHRGSTAHDDHYSNVFECAPSDRIYPPTRVERQTVQAALTATVVGPPSEEIHVDEQGRIKVHFHWDREGGGDDSSCWIRTMQAWGGASWGAQFIPRVGMEVVVAFDGGDPDKPIVLGCVYNATHPMPFAVPADKTRSGIRTRTVQGATGFNELSFRDKRDAEQI